MQYKYLIILFLCLNLNLFSQTNDLSISSYDISLKLNGLQLDITAKLECEQSQPSTKIKLLIDSTLNTKDISIGNIKTNYKIIGDTLCIDVPAELQNDKKLTLLHNYSIDTDSSNSISVLFFWYPYLKNSLSKYHLTVNSTPELCFYSAGKYSKLSNEQERDIYSYEVNRPIFRLPLTIAPKDSLIARTVHVRNTDLKYYFLPADIAKADSLISESVSAFTFYYDLIGPYPDNNLSFIDVP